MNIQKRQNTSDRQKRKLAKAGAQSIAASVLTQKPYAMRRNKDTGEVLVGQLTVGSDGRILIPAKIRAAIGIKRGGKVVAEVQDGKLIIDTLEARVRRIQKRLATFKKRGESVVDEFLADRRKEAELE